jgi:hypothetical protein
MRGFWLAPHLSRRAGLFRPKSQKDTTPNLFLDAWNGKRLDEALDLVTDDVVVALNQTAPLIVDLPKDGKRQLIRYLAAIGVVPRLTMGKDGKVGTLTFLVEPEQTAGVLMATLNPWSTAETSGNSSADRGSKTLGRIGQFVGLGGGVFAALSAFYLLFPGARPEEPPIALGAVLDNVAIEERRTTEMPSGYCQYAGESALLGTNARVLSIISFDIEFIGYKGDQTAVKWAVFDPESGERVSPELNAGPTIRPEAPNDRATGQVCVPVPSQARCVVIRVYLYEEDQTTRLDYADTAPFFTGRNDRGACDGEEPVTPSA